jgi:hypothetical protein
MNTRIPLDKAAHALGGWALVATLLPYAGPWWALLACAVVGYAKERWDRRGHGTYDPRDFWATNAGGVLALVTDAFLVFITQAITPT